MKKLFCLAFVLALSSTQLFTEITLAANQVAVYRFYNIKNGVHFFTANDNERNYIKENLSHIYRDEGVALHAYSSHDSGLRPVHRFYNTQQGVHFYTANQAEATNVNKTMSEKYQYEGIAYYIKTSSAGLSTPNFFNAFYFWY